MVSQKLRSLMEDHNLDPIVKNLHENGDLNIFNPHPTIISQRGKQKDLSGPSKILSQKHIKVAEI